MCGLKPQVGVGAAVSAKQGVLCPEWLERMVSHDAAVISKTDTLSNANSGGDDMKPARRQG